MKTIYTYLIADDSNVYAEASTRQEARNHLREVKATGNKSVKIFREEYVRLSFTQVR
jgi:hypothetical protein